MSKPTPAGDVPTFARLAHADDDDDADPLIGLAEATRLSEVKRNGRAVCLCTMHRWSGPGILRHGRRVVLRTQLVGGRRLTRRSWVLAFLEELNAPPGAPAPTPAETLDAHRRAEIELDAAGV